MVKLLLLTQPRFFFPLAHGVFSTRASHYKPAFESQRTEQPGARPATSTQKQPAGTGFCSPHIISRLNLGSLLGPAARRGNHGPCCLPLHSSDSRALHRQVPHPTSRQRSSVSSGHAFTSFYSFTAGYLINHLQNSKVKG